VIHFAECDDPNVRCAAARVWEILASEGPSSVTNDPEKVTCVGCVAGLIQDGDLPIRDALVQVVL
jgi:hypothetical protein